MKPRLLMPLLLSLTLLTLGILACQAGSFVPASTATPLPAIDSAQLRFTVPETGERFRALEACLREVAVGAGWRTRSYQTLGNSIQARWCRGADARSDCQLASGNENRRDQQALQLETFFYADEYPQVFGLHFSGLWVPEREGWGVSFYLSEGGKSIMGEGTGLIFRQYRAGEEQPVAEVSTLGGLSYRLFQTELVVTDPSAASPRAELAQALASPEALRDQALALYRALQEKVATALRNGEVVACDYDETQNNGIPPQCTPRPLTAAEQAAELERARTYFSTQQNLLAANYQEMYATLLKAFPFDRCQP
jgi:hypothetical protein